MRVQLKGERGAYAINSLYRPLLDVEGAFLHSGGGGKMACGSKPLALSFVSAIFDLSELLKRGHLLKNLRLVLLDPEGSEIFSSSLPLK